MVGVEQLESTLPVRIQNIQKIVQYVIYRLSVSVLGYATNAAKLLGQKFLIREQVEVVLDDLQPTKCRLHA